MNRVRFNGRFRGRPLAAGTYRLVVHAPGQVPAAVAVTMVVAHGRASPAFLRQALNRNSCSPAQEREIEAALGSGATGDSESLGAPADGDKGILPSVLLKVAGAVKGVTHKARASLDVEPFSDRLKAIFGLLTLASACLGTFVLFRLARTYWYR